MTRLAQEKHDVEAALINNKQELRDAREEIKKLELQIIKIEQLYEHRIAEQNEKFARDMDIELDRARATTMQSERTLDARERAHRQRISLLEDSNAGLREQLERANRAKRRNHRQTQELLSDIRRSTSPTRRQTSPNRNASPLR